MAKKDRPSKAKAERERAVQRLNEAVTERRRLRDEQVTATDAVQPRPLRRSAGRGR
jgi:hypothetical protein